MFRRRISSTRNDTVQPNGKVEPSSTEVPELELRAVLDAVVGESLRPVAVGLGVLYAVLAVSHALVLPSAVAVPMIILASVTCATLLALRYVLGRWAVPAQWAHPIGVGIAGLVLLNSLLHIFLTAEPRQTTNLMLLVVGLGFLFLSLRWLALVLLAAIAGWGLVVWQSPPSPAWTHFGFALFTATVLSVIVHTARVRTLRRLEGLRLRDGLRRVELETALRVAQRSEEELREYHDHLEQLVEERTAELTAANESLQREIGERKRTEVALQQYTERLRIMYAIGGAILAAWSPAEIARSALRHIRRLVPCQGASIVSYDFEAQEAVLFAVQVGDEVGLQTGTRIPLDKGAEVEGLRQGKILVEEDVAIPVAGAGGGERLLIVMQALQEVGVRSYVVMPLIAHGELIGSFALGADSPGAFSPEHVDIVREVADQIAVGLYQARLHEQVEQYAAGLEHRVAERTAELSAANAELARAARLKDEFLAAMTHELRTPLNVILGLSEALQEQVYGPLNEKQLKSLRGIGQSGRHLLALVSDILDVAKIEAGKLELEFGPVAVETVCQASLRQVEEAAGAKRLEVSFLMDNAVTTIQADTRRLKQVLVNLLSNAVKFTAEGGAVGMEVVGDAEREVIHFAVWDTGIGIMEDDIPRLFQPFVQLDSSLARRYEGMGLGLALAYRLTEMHGGGFSVESEVGKGSRFTVSLPWQEGQEVTGGRGDKEMGGRGDEETEQRGQESGEGGVGERVAAVDGRSTAVVLLAEDNEVSISTLSDYLLAQGYRVVVARDGTEAIQRAREVRPDLILMDIQMPTMDGLEATRLIRSDASLADIPIIALTALVTPGDRERCLEAGANGFLSKPVSLKGLFEAIEAQLQR
jgi:signal transduction histidine kinase